MKTGGKEDWHWTELDLTGMVVEVGGLVEKAAVAVVVVV